MGKKGRLGKCKENVTEFEEKINAKVR